MSTHIYFLLDRSGSMESMVGDVIGGFNYFLREQQANGDDARLTLVQFDSQDSFEMIAEALAVVSVPALTASTFQPRGGTPLLDATAQLILLASDRASRLANAGEPAEQVLFVTLTDGEENQSTRFTLQQVNDLIAVKKELGWTFVFLGAGLDAYGEAGRAGYGAGSTQAFAPDGQGAREAFSSLSRSTVSLRDKVRGGMPIAVDEFFEDKAAEADKAARS